MTAKRRRKAWRTTPATDDLPVGRIAGPFGVGGELKCDPTGIGRTVLSAGLTLRCMQRDTSRAVRIVAVRPHQKRLLIRIEGVEDADAAAAYGGAVLYAPRAAIRLAEGEYLDDDLIGCAVQGVDGRLYGSVERVEHYPSSDMLVVDGVMVPMVRTIVVEIDVDRRRIVVDPPAELFP